MTNVLLVNSVILNGGDAAIVEGTLAFLKGLGHAINARVQCHQFDVAKKYFPELPLSRALGEASQIELPHFFWRFPESKRYRAWASNPLRHLPVATPWVSSAERQALADLDWADIVVSVGGSYLTDVYKYDRMFMAPELAKRIGKKVILLGASIGPFYDDRNLDRMREKLPIFDLIIVRDRKSLDLAISLGYQHENCLLGSDFAFALPSPEVPQRDGDKPFRLGVSLRQWIYPGEGDRAAAHARYLDTMAASLDALVERHGVEILMVSTCQGIPEYAYQDDDVATEVCKRMDRKGAVTVDSTFRRPGPLSEILAGCDAFIGTRMHACILSLLSRRPTINIEYEFKSRELFSMFGLEDYVIPISSIDPDTLCAKLGELRSSYHSIQNQISMQMEEVRSKFIGIGRRLLRLMA